jgi:hypothetical protein
MWCRLETQGSSLQETSESNIVLLVAKNSKFVLCSIVKHSQVQFLVIRFLARSRLHRTPLRRRKLSHVFLMTLLSVDASQVHTESCDVISGILQA